MKQRYSALNMKSFIQRELFPASPDPPAIKSISVYRVSLVKDESVSFGNVTLANSQQAQALIQNLILTKGQPDREQFVEESGVRSLFLTFYFHFILAVNSKDLTPLSFQRHQQPENRER